MGLKALLDSGLGNRIQVLAPFTMMFLHIVLNSHWVNQIVVKMHFPLALLSKAVAILLRDCFEN